MVRTFYFRKVLQSHFSGCFINVIIAIGQVVRGPASSLKSVEWRTNAFTLTSKSPQNLCQLQAFKNMKFRQDYCDASNGRVIYTLSGAVVIQAQKACETFCSITIAVTSCSLTRKLGGKSKRIACSEAVQARQSSQVVEV